MVAKNGFRAGFLTVGGRRRQIENQPVSFMSEECLSLTRENWEVTIRNESRCEPASGENALVFDKEFVLNDEEGYVASRHSVFVGCRDGETHSCLLIAGGGGTTVHENSAFINGNEIVVAVGNYVCGLLLPILEIKWKTKTDLITCFGIHHSAGHRCYISHGECEIMRLSYSGETVWIASGQDIFTGEFVLNEDSVSVVDFNDERYLIDIKTGDCQLTAG